MSNPLRFLFQHQNLWLSPARCIFWEEEKILIVSDLHFGKSGHFRKSGIGIPQNIYKEDLQRLFTQIQFFKPDTILITGDMFHSHANKEIDFFLKWRNDIPGINFFLVKGNHDILRNEFYKEANIKVFENKLMVKSFCFTHDIAASCNIEKDTLYVFSGHIHPGIHVKGLAKQSVQVPCFYFGKNFAVLPAFSAFTGLAKIKPEKSDHVFALVENLVIKIN